MFLNTGLEMWLGLTHVRVLWDRVSVITASADPPQHTHFSNQRGWPDFSHHYPKRQNIEKYHQHYISLLWRMANSRSGEGFFSHFCTRLGTHVVRHLHLPWGGIILHELVEMISDWTMAKRKSLVAVLTLVNHVCLKRMKHRVKSVAENKTRAGRMSKEGRRGGEGIGVSVNDMVICTQRSSDVIKPTIWWGVSVPSWMTNAMRWNWKRHWCQAEVE